MVASQEFLVSMGEPVTTLVETVQCRQRSPKLLR